MKFFPARNKTLTGLAFTKDRETVEKFSFAINVFTPFIAFATALICSITLVVKLQRKTKWRKEAVVASPNAKTTTSRDQNFAKVVLMISRLFIACFIPADVNVIISLLDPEFRFDGEKRNLCLGVLGVGFVLEIANSSKNIFIYCRVSSRYRAVF